MVTDTTDSRCARWCDDHDIGLDECLHEVGSFVLDDDAPFRGELVKGGVDWPVAVQVRQFADRPQPLVEIQLVETSGCQDVDWLTPAEARALGYLLIEAAQTTDTACTVLWCRGDCEWNVDAVGRRISRQHFRRWPSGVVLSEIEFPPGDRRASLHGGLGVHIPDIPDDALDQLAQLAQDLDDAVHKAMSATQANPVGVVNGRPSLAAEVAQ